jgi:hypothetical protein
MTDDRQWAPPSAASPSPSPSGGPTAPVEVTPELRAQEQPSRSRTKLIVGVVGAVALVGAGVFAVMQLSDGDSGGAASPEEATRALFSALDEEDALGVIDVLLPGERDTLRDPAVQLFEELERLEVLSADADPSEISGVDLSFEIDDVTAEPTNVDDIVNVAVGGNASVTVDGEQLPIGDLILTNVDVDRASLDVDERDDLSVNLATVEEDGRWYVSLLYTSAEGIRQLAMGEGQPMDIPAEGLAPVGGDTPEDAFDNVLDAIEKLDASAMIASLNPDEFQALQRYAPLFLDDVQKALDDVEGVEISIDDPVYEVQGGGDRRALSIAELHAEVTVPDQPPVTIDFADGCLVVTGGGDKVDSCEAGSLAPQLDELLEDAQPVQDFLDLLTSAFDDYENVGVVVERVDGAWYVSPLATLTDQLFAATGALDSAEIQELIDAGREALETMRGEIDIAMDSEDVLDPDVLVDPPTPETVLPPLSLPLPSDASDECYAQIEAADAAACFQALIEAGELPAESVEVQMRHPECGLADAFWAGEYHGLPDADFVALVTAAAPCFQDLVASREISAGELPYELSHPQCLEGRNWYTAMSDEEDDYVDRFLECVSQ